jgi:transposase
MNNIRFHRSVVIRVGIESKGHVLLFIPPYSPFLNPIENLFSKWKQLVEIEDLEMKWNCFKYLKKH